MKIIEHNYCKHMQPSSKNHDHFAIRKRAAITYLLLTSAGMVGDEF